MSNNDRGPNQKGKGQKGNKGKSHVNGQRGSESQQKKSIEHTKASDNLAALATPEDDMKLFKLKKQDDPTNLSQQSTGPGSLGNTSTEAIAPPQPLSYSAILSSNLPTGKRVSSAYSIRYITKPTATKPINEQNSTESKGDMGNMKKLVKKAKAGEGASSATSTPKKQSATTIKADTQASSPLSQLENPGVAVAEPMESGDDVKSSAPAEASLESEGGSNGLTAPETAPEIDSPAIDSRDEIESGSCKAEAEADATTTVQELESLGSEQEAENSAPSSPKAPASTPPVNEDKAIQTDACSDEGSEAANYDFSNMDLGERVTTDRDGTLGSSYELMSHPSSHDGMTSTGTRSPNGTIANTDAGINDEAEDEEVNEVASLSNVSMNSTSVSKPGEPVHEIERVMATELLPTPILVQYTYGANRPYANHSAIIGITIPPFPPSSAASAMYEPLTCKTLINLINEKANKPKVHAPGSGNNPPYSRAPAPGSLHGSTNPADGNPSYVNRLRSVHVVWHAQPPPPFPSSSAANMSMGMTISPTTIIDTLPRSTYMRAGTFSEESHRYSNPDYYFQGSAAPRNPSQLPDGTIPWGTGLVHREMGGFDVYGNPIAGSRGHGHSNGLNGFGNGAFEFYTGETPSPSKWAHRGFEKSKYFTGKWADLTVLCDEELWLVFKQMELKNWAAHLVVSFEVERAEVEH